MKKMIKIASRLETSMLLILLISSLTLYFSIHALAANSAPGFRSSFAAKADTSFSSAITSQLAETKKKLYFPASVERFYKQQGFKLIWVAPDNVKTHAPEAMLLLDCVLQYGLSHSDYHPQELLYEKLRTITERYNSVSDIEKARFDIMLTDAMIAFMNNLHFGKLNPDFPASRIDAGKGGDLKAELVLANAIRQNDFVSNVLSAQPKSKEYIDLQNHMHLYTGQYLDDCYQVPEGDIKIMAINLERLRWAGLGGSSYVHINIPSYTLKLHQKDSIYQFKVVVGKPANPSPTLQSAISYFMTAPDWRVPHKIFVKELLPKALANRKYIENSHFSIFDLHGNYINPSRARLIYIQKHPDGYYAKQAAGCDNSLGMIVFRFDNIYDIYLHDTPEQQFFAKDQRAFSHGCIRVQNAENLAAMLLKNDGSAKDIPAMHYDIMHSKMHSFILNKRVPIMITYLTCEMKEGVLVKYDDIYNLDKSLELAFNYEIAATR